MTKEEIATVLEQIATLLELKGENQFKIRGLYEYSARDASFFKRSIFPQRVDTSSR